MTESKLIVTLCLSDGDEATAVTACIELEYLQIDDMEDLTHHLMSSVTSTIKGRRREAQTEGGTKDE